MLRQWRFAHARSVSAGGCRMKLLTAIIRDTHGGPGKSLIGAALVGSPRVSRIANCGSGRHGPLIGWLRNRRALIHSIYAVSEVSLRRRRSPSCCRCPSGAPLLLAGDSYGLKRGLRVTAVFGLTYRREMDWRQLGAAAARKCGRKQGRGQRHSMGFRHPLPRLGLH